MDTTILRELAAAAPKQEIYPNALFPPSVYYRFLRLLTEQMKPKCSVELGMGGGGGSLHLALGHLDGMVIGIDKSDVHPVHVAHILEICPNVEFWRMDSVEAADHARQVWSKSPIAPDGDLHLVSVLFIDTLHTYEQTMAEFAAWKDLLAPGAAVILDDLFRSGMDRVWQELPGEKIRFDDLHIGSSPTDGGFGIILL